MTTLNRERGQFTLLSPVPHQQERLQEDQVPWTWGVGEETIPGHEIRFLSSGIPYVLIVPQENILKKFNVDYRVTLPVLKYARRIILDHLDAQARSKVVSIHSSAMRCTSSMTSGKRTGSKEDKVLLILIFKQVESFIHNAGVV